VTFLEVGAGRVLSSLTQKILNHRSLRYLVLNTIQKDHPNELDSLKWSAQKLQLKGFPINQREFSQAIGEDFVENISNAFSSSFRLAKTGSLNAKHHRVAYQRNAPPKRQLSVKLDDPSGHRTTRRRSNPQLVLTKRQVVVEELDAAIIAEHQLFDEVIIPAAYQFRCFSEHLHLQQIHLHDVQFVKCRHSGFTGH
jgi:acyl transferase domain-containing protein